MLPWVGMLNYLLWSCLIYSCHRLVHTHRLQEQRVLVFRQSKGGEWIPCRMNRFLQNILGIILELLITYFTLVCFWFFSLQSCYVLSFASFCLNFKTIGSGSWSLTIMHFLFSADSLTVEALLELLDEESLMKETALPSPEWSSDHVALRAEFRCTQRSRRWWLRYALPFLFVKVPFPCS